MDEHARRMAGRFLDAVEAYRSGGITLLDLSRQARQVADTLDNASAPLPELLRRAEGDLEYIYFATERAEHCDRAEQIVRPILDEITSGDRRGDLGGRSEPHERITEIRLGEVGRIEKGDAAGRYVEVLDDHEASGGFLILTYESEDRGGPGFDSWVESIVDVELFFEEAGWSIVWADR